MYKELKNNLEYYSSANPSLYSSIQWLARRPTVDDFYVDPVPNYLLHQYVQDCVSLLPAFKFEDFQRSVSEIYSSLTTYKYIESVTTLYLTTPSPSSWDTPVSVPTSGDYSGLYMNAKCKALVDDCLDYPGWYNTFMYTDYSQQGLFSTIKDHYVYSIVDGTGIPFSDGAVFYRYEDCQTYVKLIDVLPWKERLLAARHIIRPVNDQPLRNNQDAPRVHEKVSAPPPTYQEAVNNKLISSAPAGR
ncbi:unnamed protein product [Ambrosiozyma monospora]|uniref:Unnamed protein product n=1 Tax=Ambrosiozyma monospora TaxID=43982 RepID=A0ACB5SV83_AMBMO|nr:unnamed protein product [Ambrosiozyma monospora]